MFQQRVGREPARSLQRNTRYFGPARGHIIVPKTLHSRDSRDIGPA
jgi:hypothetical protein